MNGDRHRATSALDDAMRELSRLQTLGDQGRLSEAEYRVRAIDIRDCVMRMANPDPVDPSGGGSAGGPVTTKCPHCNGVITVTVTK